MKNKSAIGRRIAELRRSGAAGKHDSRHRSVRTRSAARRTAVNESRADR